MQLNQEDIKNLIALVNAAPIKGIEAKVVVALIDKLTAMQTNDGTNTGN